MRLGTQEDLTVALQGMGLSGRLNTAFIERVNLMVRHGVSALARRTWATAQEVPQLLAHLQWWFAYSHQPVEKVLTKLISKEGVLASEASGKLN